MADQRQYNVTATTNFDGSTVATEALAWTPGANSQTAPANVRYRSASTTVVGRFPPAILGRDDRSPALVRVWADRVTAGDLYRVVGSRNIANANPISTVRSSALLTVGQQQATILELGMTDELEIVTEAPTAVHIEVIDLDEKQLLAYVLEKFRNDATVPAGTTEIVVTASGIIPSIPGHLLVDVAIAAGGILDLPDLAGGELSPGDRITFFRSAGDAGRTVQIRTQSGADLVNGLGGVAATSYYLRDAGDSISYLVTESRGYQREFGTQATIEVLGSANPLTVSAPKGGIGFFRDEGTDPDNVCQLPAVDNGADFIPSGAAVVVLNTDTQRHQFQPDGGGDLINNGLNFYWNQPGRAALLIAIRSDVANGPSGWRAFGGGNQGRAVASAVANVTLTAAQVSGNICTVVTSGAAGQQLILPPVGEVENGSTIYWYNPSGNTHALTPNGTDLINSVNAPGSLATTERMVIVAMSEPGAASNAGWVTILGA